MQANNSNHYLERDRWTRQQLEDYQARALQACREYAYAHSPFYQRFHRGLTDRPLHELPVLTKAMLMEHFDELVTDRAIRLEDVRHYLADPGGQEGFLNRYRVMATSGSTGQPGVFLASQAERADLTVGFSRFPAWAGVPPATKFAMVASTASGHMTSQIPAMVNGQLLPRLQLSASDPVEQLVRQLNEWQPGMVAGYPSILGVLAQEQQQGRLQITPDFIASGSEVLTEETRQRIEQAWHTRLFNIYAATESGVLASECASHRGLHLYEDLTIVEVADEQNRPVPPGVYGDKVLLTVLFSRTQPLIRYE
ncbi:MAG TPA: AMP-binding protein, partial [Ktedonobacteraceae bacterium]